MFFNSLPLEVEKELYFYLSIKSLKELLKVNKYLKGILKKEINIIASNKIKCYFKKIIIPKHIYELEEDEENKLSKKEWVHTYYFYYDKNNIESQINLIVRKIFYLYGEKRQNDIQNILDNSINLSKRYKLINCIKNMTKEEIQDIGW
jgi:hypothetical protein